MAALALAAGFVPHASTDTQPVSAEGAEPSAQDPSAAGTNTEKTAARFSARSPRSKGRPPSVPPPAPGRCVHPYPCGDEWPDDLEGPFELDRVEYVRLPVPADHDDPDGDQIMLEGWIGIPEIPEGAPEDLRFPVALTSSPYVGNSHVNFTCPPDADRPDAPGCDITPAQDQFWTDEPGPGPIRNWGINPIELVRRGYAVAVFSQRGTGNSGGCWSLYGEDAQTDAAVITNWAAEQPWSNGRVGMGGLSYRSVPPVAAAVSGDASALKTIVITGTVLDFYTAVFTPQGALRFWDAFFVDTLIPQAVSGQPPFAGGAEAATIGHIPVLPERACADVLQAMGAGERDWLAQDRNEEFWTERSFLDRLPDITTSVLLAQGFQDSITHGFQDSPFWSLTPRAPKRQITGQWGHAYPWPNPDACRQGEQNDACSWFDGVPWGEDQDTWSEILFAWLDYWLKGQGEPPRLGTADYQDTEGDWHASTAWPPSEVREEVLYLGGGTLSAEAVAGELTTRPAPTQMNPSSYRADGDTNNTALRPWAAFCPDPVTAAAGAGGLVYVSNPLEQETLLAGNPFAHLELSSDQPGGTVRVQVAEIIGGSTECDAAGQPSNVRVLTGGAADLRFHQGNFSARDFPTKEHVRVDLWDFADTIPAGSRLAVVIVGAEPVDEWTGQPYQPELTVHAGSLESSQIVLPVVSGTTGGGAPTVDYPPRPFLPETTTVRPR